MAIKLPEPTNSNSNSVSASPEPTPQVTTENLVQGLPQTGDSIGPTQPVAGPLNQNEAVREPSAVGITPLQRQELIAAARANMDVPLPPTRINAQQRQEIVDMGLGTRKSRDVFYPQEVRARDYNLAQIKNTNEVAQAMGVSAEEAQRMLIENSPEEIKAKAKMKDLDVRYPGLTDWAKRPENFKIMQAYPDSVIKLAEATEEISMSGDLKRVAVQNYYSIQAAAIHSMMATKAIDFNTGVKLLTELQDNIDKNGIQDFAVGAEKIGKSAEEFGKAVDDNLFKFKTSVLSEVAKGDFFSTTSMFKYLKSAIKAANGSVKGLAKLVTDAYENPEAMSLVALQSAHSSVPPLAALVAGTAVAGPGAGAVASGATAGVVSFAQYFQQKQEEFRDPKTGKINFEAMYSNPEILEEMRIQATKYAGTHAAMEYIGGRVLNASLSKTYLSTLDQKGIVTKALTMGKGTAKALATEAVQEGVGETAAQLAIGNSLGEALSEGAIESIAGGLMGVGGVTAQLGVIAYKAPKIKQVAEIQRRFQRDIDEAAKAFDEAEAVAKAREAIKESGGEDFKQQMTELIESQTVEAVEDSEGNIIERPKEITFMTDDIQNIAESLGEDVMDILNVLGQEAKDGYISAITKGDKSFKMDFAAYITNALEYPELDNIIYIGENSLTAEQAKAFLANYDSTQTALDNLMAQAIDGEDLDSDAVLRDAANTILKEEGGTPIMTQTGPDGEFEGEFDLDVRPEVDPNTGEDIDVVMRPIEPMVAGMTDNEVKALDKIKKGLTSSLKGSVAQSYDPDTFEDLVGITAELALRNLKMRAEVLGVSLDSLVDKHINFGKVSQKDQERGTLAYFRPIRPDGRTSIHFGPNTTPDTVIHEFGHTWLHYMSEDWSFISTLDQRTELQEEYYQAMLAVADSYDIDNVSLINFENQTLPTEHIRKIHESFAKTAERYFLEGENDTPRLANALNFFRRAFSNFIAKIMGKYPQYPALKINAKTKRIFEAILHASDKTEETTRPMFPDPMYDPLLLGTGEIARRYREAMAEARAAAQIEVYAKAFNKGMAEREKAIAQIQKAFYERARAIVAEFDSMVFKRAMVNGPAENRISYESVKQVLFGGDDTLMKQMVSTTARGIIAGQKKAGVDIRHYMKQLGIKSKEEMVAFLTETSMEDILVEDTFNQLIEQEMPALKTDAEIHADAVQAIVNKGRDAMLKIELEMLAQKSTSMLQKLNSKIAMPAKYLNRKVIQGTFNNGLKNQGEMKVRNAPITGMSPKYFEREMNRFGRQAALALIKGDFDKAFEFKQQEAIFYHAMKAAAPIEKKITKTLKKLARFRQINPRTVARELDVDYVSYLKAMANAVADGVAVPFYGQEHFKYNGFNQPMIDTINQKINNFNEALRTKGIKAITVDDMTNLVDVVNIVAAQAKMGKVKLDSDREVAIAKIVSMIEEEVESAPGGVKHLDKNFLAGLTSEFPSMLNFIAGLFPDDEAMAKSTLFKVYSIFAAAEANKDLKKKEDRAVIVEAAKAVAHNDPEIQSILKGFKNRFNQMLTGISGKPIEAPEIDYTFQNKGELIQFILYWGSQSGQEVLIKGGLTDENGFEVKIGGWDPATDSYVAPDVQAMLDRMMEDGTITKEMMDFAQVIWDIYEKHFPEFKKSIREVYDYDIGHIEPKAFRTKWGEYRGGYVPLNRKYYTLEASTKVVLNHFNSDGPAGQSAQDIYPFYKPSMALERTGKVLPLSLDLSQLNSYLNLMYRAAYLMPAASKLAKIITHEDFQTAMEKKRPGYLHGFVYPNFNRVMSMRYTDTPDSAAGKAFTRIVSAMRRNSRVGAFIFNVASALKQYLGLGPAAAIIPPHYLVNAAIEVGLSPKVYQDAVMERSPRMKALLKDFHTRTLESMEEFTLQFDKISEFGQLVDSATFFMISATQAHTSTMVYIAAENYARRSLKLETDAEVEAYASGVVERSQGSTALASRPLALSGNEIKRAAFDFLTPVLTGHGIVREAMWRNASKPLRNKIGTLAYVAGFAAAIPVIGSVIIGQLMRGKIPLAGLFEDEEDEKESELDSLMAAVAKESIDFVAPVYGNILIGLGSAAGGNLRPLSRAVPIVGNTIAAATAGKYVLREADLFFDSVTTGEEYNPKMTRKQFRAVLDSMTFATGVPFAIGSRLDRYYVDLLEPLIDADEDSY